MPNAEFASDAFDPSLLNPDDLEREMKELGMDENIPEWEHELQKELQVKFFKYVASNKTLVVDEKNNLIIFPGLRSCKREER